MERVSQSQEAAECLVSQLATFTFGKVAAEDTACLMQRARSLSLSKGGDALEALRGFAGSDAYVTRKATP
jgi:hypothetical protein